MFFNSSLTLLAWTLHTFRHTNRSDTPAVLRVTEPAVPFPFTRKKKKKTYITCVVALYYTPSTLCCPTCGYYCIRTITTHVPSLLGGRSRYPTRTKLTAARRTFYTFTGSCLAFHQHHAPFCCMPHGSFYAATCPLGYYRFVTALPPGSIYLRYPRTAALSLFRTTAHLCGIRPPAPHYGHRHTTLTGCGSHHLAVRTTHRTWIAVCLRRFSHLPHYHWWCSPLIFLPRLHYCCPRTTAGLRLTSLRLLDVAGFTWTTYYHLAPRDVCAFAHICCLHTCGRTFAPLIERC